MAHFFSGKVTHIKSEQRVTAPTGFQIYDEHEKVARPYEVGLKPIYFSVLARKKDWVPFLYIFTIFKSV